MKILSDYFGPTGPGAALAIAVDGQSPQIQCRGLADVRRGIEITADTVFDLASAGKTFTAVGVLLLVERGRLRLADPVGDYLPAVARPETGRPITLRDLLWHTSGLPDYLESGVLADPGEVSPASILDRLPKWSRRARAGVVHRYSNTNYFVLSKVLESVSGIGFAEFIESNLLCPLGLDSTSVPGGRSAPAATAKGYRNTGYGLPSIEPSRDFPLETLGDGGVYSSLNDLLRWQSGLWSAEVVSRGSLDLMQSPGALDSGEPFEYGFGLQVERREGHDVWCGHGGSWTGSTVLIGRYLADGASVLVLSNEVMAPVERISQAAIAWIRDFRR